MKNIGLVLYGLGVALLIGLEMASLQQQKELYALEQICDTATTQRIEALEKEMRVLKMDLYIMQNGFEDEK